MSDKSTYRKLQRELQMARDANADPGYIKELEQQLRELYENGD